MSELTLRVTKMENILDDLTEIVEKSYEIMNDLKSNLDKLKTLKEYYDSQYMKDFIADERNEIPKDLKRGVLSEDAVSELFAECFAQDGYQLTVDLEKQQVISPSGKSYAFDVDEFRKHCLLNGLDDIGLTLQQADSIKAYEENAKQSRPWVFGTGAA